ncbi:hypothetical protein [Listeria costaricensis]|uniref:hypothetical protein n=1 Tax=Listeria costaricensis TaxID=2026604 RepID=UPI000C068341|nr:hypothetical protein [Listeria costaricensis]
MGFKERLENEVHEYAATNHFSVDKIDFLYAGPTMRTRHTLVLGFTDAGLFTFLFKLGEAEMHYLASEKLRQMQLQPKRMVYTLTITGIDEDGQTEEARYLVSKRVLGRKWHRQTLQKLIEKDGKTW